MPYAHLPKEKAEALEALERLLLRHRIVSEDEARRAARLIAEDPDLEFPPQRAQQPSGETADERAKPSTS